MPATATHDTRLVGKLLLTTALVVISAAYGYWQNKRQAPSNEHFVSAAATPSPMPRLAAAPASAAAANDAAPAPADSNSAVTDAPSDSAAPVTRTALADKPAAVAAAPAPVAAAPLVQEGPAASAITMPAGLHLEDGEYISQHEDFEWGTVQVKVVIRNGAFNDVQFIQMPDHRPHSEELTDMSKPILAHEAIHDQKSAVDLVTTATYTSMAYQDAMADVIMRATRQ